MSDLSNSPDDDNVFIFVVKPVRSRFALGEVVATPGALDLLDRTGVNASSLLRQHERGDWGALCADDAAANDRAVIDGDRVLSAYELGSGRERLWIITEHDRSVTTLLLPGEY
jgi:hypothetical protein